MAFGSLCIPPNKAAVYHKRRAAHNPNVEYYRNTFAFDHLGAEGHVWLDNLTSCPGRLRKQFHKLYLQTVIFEEF
eukprot:5993228-Amphidinium_carterae.1